MKTKTKAAVGVLLFAMLLAAISPFGTPRADAFEPWKSGQSQFRLGGGTAGPLDASHASITEQAITNFALHNLSCDPSETALREIVKANGMTDFWDALSPKAHFDAESFAAGQERLRSKLENIRNSMNAGRVPAAREALGEALHAIQDFYSHSNWVETHLAGEIYADLGRRGALDIAPGATCSDCGSSSGCEGNLLMPSPGWTSGYFALVLSYKPAGKCSHGGSLDRTAGSLPKGGINKDSSNSPHGSKHNAAADSARRATEMFLSNLEGDGWLTHDQVKRLLCGPTLAFCIDTTAGMGDIIEAVKTAAIAIVDARLGTDEEPSQYVLALFNDPDVPDAIVTTDANEFKNAIRNLSANGGGDCPEMAVSGIIKGLSAASTSGDLFVFTDADAKDASLAAIAADLATQKQIKVFFSIFGSCDYDAASKRLDAFSPLRKHGQEQVASHGVDPVYRQMAEATGGQVFSLDPSEAGQIRTLLDDVSRTRAVNLLSIEDTLGPTASTYSVPVDGSMSSVTFAVSGGTSVTLTRPDGTVVHAGDPGVTITSLSGAYLVSIENPAVGLWRISVSGSGAFSITVTGEGTFDIESFDFVRAGGDQAHEPGLFPIDGFPIAGQANIVTGELTEGTTSAQFEFRSPSGPVLQVLALQQGIGIASNVFVGSVIPPNTPFLVYATGHTSSGASFQRLLPGTRTPQSVTIAAPIPVDLTPGTSTTYIFNVHNFGSADTFDFVGSDDQEFLTSITPATFSLGADETREVTVQLNTPADAVLGTTDTLTVTATGRSSAGNFAVIVSDVSITSYTVMTSISPPNGGTTSGAGTFTSGSTVTVNATPNAGYGFVSWTENGVVVSTAASYTFTVSSDRALVANFVSLLPTAATPEIFPHGGTFSHKKGGTIVHMSCATPGATIYYTKDGSDPTTSSQRYPAKKNYRGFKINGPAGSTKVVKAIAIAPGYNNSAIATASFTFRR